METIQKIIDAITARLQEKISASEFNYLTKLKNEILFDCQKQNEVKNLSSNSMLTAGWLAVEDKLPETNEDVLVWSNQMKRPRISFYDGEAVGWGGKKLYVTHWMELPSQPTCS